MHDGGIRAALRHLRTLAAVRPAAALSDGDLLGRFAETHDEAAFTVLVERHGPMVLGVCRRVLGHAQDAEDACQATFLVLVRKAASVRRRGSVASWLYGVAVRAARKLRASRARQARGHAYSERVAAGTVADDLSWREARAVLDEELLRLPEKYRAPLVLCYLEGLTRDEAARRLGLNLNRLRGRLDYARGLLRARLTRRGVGLSAALLAGLAGQEAPAALRVVSTGKAAALIAAGRALPAGLVPARVAALTEGTVRAMFLKNLLSAVAASLLLAGLGVGVGTAVQGDPGTSQTGERPQKAVQADPPKQAVHPINKSLEGLTKHYALPEGEVLKAFRPPHPEERKEFFRVARQPNDTTEWDGNLILLWKNNRLEFGSVTFGTPQPRGQSVESLLRFVAGIAVEDIEGDRDLRWKHSIPGDFVVREGAPAAKIVARLEEILNQEFKLPVKLTLAEADRTVYVLSGKYKFTPAAQGGKDGVIELYTTGVVPVPDIPRPGGAAYPGGSFSEFVRELGRFADRRVMLGKAEGLPAQVSWKVNFPDPYSQGAAPAEWDAVHAGPALKHVTEQTGLTIRPETRRVRVLTVERRK
jgi:RNA polymerase sigma factor (sigma-70 family)